MGSKSATPTISLDKNTQTNSYYTVVFILAAAFVAAIAGGVATICAWRGGQVEWSVRFWALVKVACRFN